MKFGWSTLLVLFAAIDIDVQVGVEAFTVSTSVLTRSVIGIRRPSSATFQRKHHLGDVEHDLLAEEVDQRDSKRNSMHESDPNDNSAEDVVVLETVAVALDDASRKAALQFVLALGLALMLAKGAFQSRPVFAAEQYDAWLSGNGSGATTVVLSAGSVKDSDIADFSMPSYESATRAEVNSNLKGENYLLGEASKNYQSSSPSSTSSSSSSSPETATPVVDEKAQKAAAKAAAKAARAQQQAAIEEAAKAAASSKQQAATEEATKDDASSQQQAAIEEDAKAAESQ